jgi:hypothetical protein
VCLLFLVQSYVRIAESGEICDNVRRIQILNYYTCLQRRFGIPMVRIEKSHLKSCQMESNYMQAYREDASGEIEAEGRIGVDRK